MLKQIPIVHPAIMLGSLAILGTLIYYDLRGSLDIRIIIPIVMLNMVICSWSLQRRKAKLSRKYSKKA